MSDQIATVGERLKAARNLCGLTQEFVASQIGVTKATYGRYESGGLTAPSDVFSKIVRVLQEAAGDLVVTADLLLFGEPPDTARAGTMGTKRRLQNFGAMTGLIFGHESVGLNGGYAEISIGGVDASSLVLALRDAEEQKPQPNKGAVKALERVEEMFLATDVEFVAEVPIARYAVSLVPRFPAETHMAEPRGARKSKSLPRKK